MSRVQYIIRFCFRLGEVIFFFNVFVGFVFGIIVKRDLMSRKRVILNLGINILQG